MATGSHLSRMITAKQLSEQLGGQLQPHTLRKLARMGRIPGAVRIGPRNVYFDRRTAGWLIHDLAEPPPRYEGLPDKVWGDVEEAS